jgi:endonuclease YncB( thermonuclease family)
MPERVAARLAAGLMLLAAAACSPGAAEAPAEPAEAPTAGLFEGATVSEGERFACTPTQVWDGDGPIHCAEGPRIRLAGIAAREMDGSCRPGHPCPEASAEAARDHLAGLLGRRTGSGPNGHVLIEGPALSCASEGSAGGKRTAAWCASPGQGDLSCAMVASGLALRWDRYWGGHSCP